jgi:hypothetical protein
MTLTAAPPKAAPRPVVKEHVEKENPVQPYLTDFGPCKRESCRKMVMGFEKENHAFEAHRGKKVEWKRLG